jgi:signal transduction histidine kinase/CheY-like chemotaxis protein
MAARTQNFENLMNVIYEEIERVFRPDSFFIAFLDDTKQNLEFGFLIENGKRSANERHPLGNGWSSKVIADKKPLLILDFEKEKQSLPAPLTFGKDMDAFTWIGVPLSFENKVIGLVNIQSQKSNAWNEEDIQLFFTIVDQIAGTIEKARLFEEARTRLERLAVLNRIGMLAASAQNINQLLNNIYEEINAIFKPHAFFIAFYDAKSDELEFKILVDEGQKMENQRVPLGKGLSYKVIAEKRPLVVNHYEKEKADLPLQMIGGKSRSRPAQSWIGVPLMVTDELIGIVNIQSFEPNVWNPEDQQLFFTIVDQIGAIIQKARLYEAVQQELNERKRAEEEKKRLEMQLRQAQKMEAIGTLAGGIAHDFNNILYPIIGYAEMTMDLVPEQSTARNNLNEILVASDRAKELIQQILAFSRQQESNPQSLRIQPIIKEALKLMRSSMPATISIIQNIDEQCGPVLTDPSQIHQIIMNLCTNAYHAMRKQGGILEVALSEIDVKPGQTDKAFQLYPGLYLCLAVRDTGHGIDPLIMDRIFDPYFTTKPPGEGTGMGLALVHGIVKSYGGETFVISQPGKGATFQIYLPRIMEPEEETIMTMPKCISGQGERILFVDDEGHILSLVEQMLESLNYRVVAKTNSLEALEEFRMNPDLFDLVITDQTMPGLTGFDLAKKMLTIRPEIAIILCTGYSELVNEEQVKAAGIRKFILKPILKSQLSILIREVLDEK